MRSYLVLPSFGKLAHDHRPVFMTQRNKPYRVCFFLPSFRYGKRSIGHSVDRSSTRPYLVLPSFTEFSKFGQRSTTRPATKEPSATEFLPSFYRVFTEFFYRVFFTEFFYRVFFYRVFLSVGYEINGSSRWLHFRQIFEFFFCSLLLNSFFLANRSETFGPRAGAADADAATPIDSAKKKKEKKQKKTHSVALTASSGLQEPFRFPLMPPPTPTPTPTPTPPTPFLTAGRHRVLSIRSASFIPFVHYRSRAPRCFLFPLSSSFAFVLVSSSCSSFSFFSFSAPPTSARRHQSIVKVTTEKLKMCDGERERETRKKTKNKKEGGT